MWIDYNSSMNVLVSVKGHAFDRPAFERMLHAIATERGGLTWTLVDQPATDALIEGGARAFDRFSAILFYDMPGIMPLEDGRLSEIEPTESWKKGFEALLSAGKPMLFLHHAIAGWPAYPRYSEVIGARFLFQKRNVDGVEVPDSGYRHDCVHWVAPVGQHPVTIGLEDGFRIQDELYIFDVFEDDVVPLMSSDHDFGAEGFYSCQHAVKGRLGSNEGWSRPRGSRLFA